MRKIFVACFVAACLTCYGQKPSICKAALLFHYNKTVYDRTKTNNNSGVGGGAEASFGSGSFHPLLQITGDLFGGTKELYLTANGEPVDAKETLLKTLAGIGFDFTKQINISAVAGPVFYNGIVHFGFSPALNLYLSASRRWKARALFTHVYQRDQVSSQSFGYIGLGLGVTVF